MEVDPYETLGVSREADLDEIKLAFRKAVLKHHPDSYAGDPAEAERTFRELTEAYRTLLHSFVPSAWAPPGEAGARTFTPQDFAREGFGGSRYGHAAVDDELRGDAGSAAGFLRRKHTYATRNETAIFVCFWLVAIVLGVAVGYLTAHYRGLNEAGAPQTSDILVSIALAEGIYAAVAAATIAVLVLTRKLIKLTLQFASQRWRVLPGPKRDRDLPRSSSGRELPGAEE